MDNLSIEQSNAELKKLEYSLSRWETIAKLIGVIAMILSCWLTARGLFLAQISTDTTSTQNMLTALMTAAMAAVVIGGGTILLMGLSLHASKAFRKAVLMLTLAIMPLVFSVSTYNAIISTSSEKSMIYDMRDNAKSWQDYVSGSAQETAKIDSAKASLLPLKSSLCTLADGETSNGLISGSAGKGAISAAYASSCSSVVAIIQTLDDIKIQSANHGDTIKQALAKMEEIPRDQSISVFKRQYQFKEQDRILRDAFGVSGTQKITKQVSAQLEIVKNSIAVVGHKQGAFGDRQAQAVQNLKASLNMVSKTINGLLDGYGQSSKAMPDGLLSMDEATFKYWDRNISNIMIAVATDCFSLWLIAFLLISKQMVQSRRDEITAALNHTNT